MRRFKGWFVLVGMVAVLSVAYAVFGEGDRPALGGADVVKNIIGLDDKQRVLDLRAKRAVFNPIAFDREEEDRMWDRVADAESVEWRTCTYERGIRGWIWSVVSLRLDGFSYLLSVPIVDVCDE